MRASVTGDQPGLIGGKHSRNVATRSLAKARSSALSVSEQVASQAEMDSSERSRRSIASSTSSSGMGRRR